MDYIELVCEETFWTFPQFYAFPIQNNFQSQGCTTFFRIIYRVHFLTICCPCSMDCLFSYCFHPWGPGCLGLPLELASMCFRCHNIFGPLSVHCQGMGSSLHHFQGPFWNCFSGSFSNPFLQPLQPHPQRPFCSFMYVIKQKILRRRGRTTGKWANMFRSFSTHMRRPC